MTSASDFGSLFLFACVAYLCGSIPAGVLIAKRRGVAIREQGSGNIGATNVARSVGTTAGGLTLACDIVKGLLPVATVRWCGFDATIQASCAVMAVVGHLFPIFLRFSGGKGVATGLGVLLALTPAAILAALAGFGAVFAVTRIVSLASLVAAALAPLFIFWFGYPSACLWGGILIALLVTTRHHENIARLLRGEESRFRASNS